MHQLCHQYHITKHLPVLRCYHSLILHPRSTTNAMLGVLRRNQTTTRGLTTFPLPLTRVLHDFHSLHLLRCTLQQHLLPNQPNGRTLLFLRNRSRHRWRTSHCRRARHLRRHIPSHRPHQIVPPSNQTSSPYHCRLLLSLYLGTPNSKYRRNLRHPIDSRRGFF
jgi:hypothetical protein